VNATSGKGPMLDIPFAVNCVSFLLIIYRDKKSSQWCFKNYICDYVICGVCTPLLTYRF